MPFKILRFDQRLKQQYFIAPQVEEIHNNIDGDQHRSIHMYPHTRECNVRTKLLFLA